MDAGQESRGNKSNQEVNFGDNAEVNGDVVGRDKIEHHYYGSESSNPIPTLTPPEQQEAVCQFLEAIENRFKTLKLFHTRQPVLLQEQYIPIQVTLERKYHHEIETIRAYQEDEIALKRAYALKPGEETSQRTQVAWKKAKKQSQKIMVLADPGMGKSTLLRKEAGTKAQEERQKLLERCAENSEVAVLKQALDQVVFPLFLRLSDLAEIAVENKTELIDAIPLLINRDYPEVASKIQSLLQEKLKNGHCWLLLDALDEVQKEQRIKLSETLNRLISHYPCVVICTSRIVGYGGAFVEGAKEMEIVPFSAKQTQEYIEIWFKNAAEYIEDDSISAKSLIQEIREKPQIEGLAQNPLLLSLLCSLYQEKGLTLPARRCQVYAKAVEYMLGKWGVDNQRQFLDEARVSAKKALLEQLAYQFSSESKEIFSMDELRNQIEQYLRSETVCSDFRNVPAADLIRELSEQDGMIQKLDRKGDQYLFLHRTFQEYLTACYLTKIEQGIALARAHFWDYDWHETLCLMAGLRKDPVPFIKAITAEKDDIFQTLLSLAGQCLAECPEISHPLVAEIIDRIVKFWHSYPDAGFINSTVVALGKVNGLVVQQLLAALQDSDLLVRGQAAEALGRIGTPQEIPVLISALQDSDLFVRGQAVEALGRIGNLQAVAALISALQHSDYHVRSSAVEVLGRIGTPQAVAALISALQHSDLLVRSSAVEVLGRIGNPQAVAALISALQHSDSDVSNFLGNFVRKEAAELLGEIRTPQAVEASISALQHPESYVRRKAAEALGRIGDPQAIPALISALQDSNFKVRCRAAEALGCIGNPQAIPTLISALQDSEPNVRCRAAEALGRIGDAKTLEKLINSLEIDIYRRDIFPLARTLAVRFSKENLPFIPVYPAKIRLKKSPILALVSRYSRPARRYFHRLKSKLKR
jgi:HEAT repeat protein